LHIYAFNYSVEVAGSVLGARSVVYGLCCGRLPPATSSYCPKPITLPFVTCVQSQRTLPWILCSRRNKHQTDHASSLRLIVWSNFLRYFRSVTVFHNSMIICMISEHSYSTTNKMHLLSQIIYSCKTLYMFRTVFPSIIRSSKLRIQQLYMSNSCCYLLLSVISLFILVKRRTCSGRSFRLSSGAQNCVYSNGIC
jgi:hypothetical protein